MRKGLIHLILVLAILQLACQTYTEHVYKKFLIGSTCDIKFYLKENGSAENILVEIDTELERIDSLLNRFSDVSLVSELNKNQRVKAPQDIIKLIVLSDSIAQMTGGLFDITVAPLLEIWGFYENKFQNPDTMDIKSAVGLVDYRKIQIKNDSLILPVEMKIDLGGIAQGYAADRIAVILKKYNIESALINIGGEIVAIGRSPEARLWRIGIKNPRGDGLIETVEIEDLALSTSGDYEKFFFIKDKRYPHIIDPRTGFPALDFVSVTIFAKSAAYADAVATAVAILGAEKGLEFLDSSGIHGIIYYDENGQIQRAESK